MFVRLNQNIFGKYLKTQMGASLHQLPFRFLVTVVASSRQATVYYAGLHPEGCIP
jgi:hypothetical protein